MSAPHGATHASNNRGRNKDGRGKAIGLPGLITLVLPNRKAKHRAKAGNFVLKYEIAYIRNRWHVELKPKLRKIMARMK